MREGSRGIRVLTLSRGILNIQSLSTYAAPTGEYRCFRSHVSRTPGGAGSPPSPVHTQTKSRKLIHAAPVTDDRYPCVPCVSRLLRRLFTGTRLSTAVATPRAVASLEPATVWAATDGRGLVGLDGCEVRLCDPCARVRPCVPCVPAPPGVFLPVPGFGCRVVVPKSQPRTGVRVCRWVWMVVRFVCVLRVSACARVPVTRSGVAPTRAPREASGSTGG